VPEFQETAHILDWRRLGKQRLEARQILKTLQQGGGWSNHPAVKMWRGYENALIEYSNVMIQEWIKRGYNNTMELLEFGSVIMPHWIGDDRFHSAHRSNLLRKQPDYYTQFNWPEGPDLPYFWPEQIREENDK
jgi:hypothetical protein